MHEPSEQLRIEGLKQPAEYAIPGRPWLAVSAAPDGSFDLYLMKGDARHLVALGETPWDERYATLSPDRRHIAFPSDKYGTYDVFVTDLNAGGNPVGTHRLTSSGGDELSPVWSPDGSRIAYNARLGTDSQIEVIDASGGAPQVLPTENDAYSPAWSPDGRHIAYESASKHDPTDMDIWIMGAGGSHPRDVIDATAVVRWTTRQGQDASMPVGCSSCSALRGRDRGDRPMDWR